MPEGVLSFSNYCAMERTNERANFVSASSPTEERYSPTFCSKSETHVGFKFIIMYGTLISFHLINWLRDGFNYTKHIAGHIYKHIRTYTRYPSAGRPQNICGRPWSIFGTLRPPPTILLYQLFTRSADVHLQPHNKIWTSKLHKSCVEQMYVDMLQLKKKDSRHLPH